MSCWVQRIDAGSESALRGNGRGKFTHLGRKHTPEARAKISAAQRGRTVSPESATVGIPIYQLVEKAWELYKIDKDSQVLGSTGATGSDSALREGGEVGR